jgi:DNA polymerase III subunit chi
MGNVLFYQLTQSPLERALPMLIEKALAARWRVAVRGLDDARLRWLDEKLWLGAEDRFLPHGLAGGAHDADQPVLLTAGNDLLNGAACLMAIDGAEVAPAEAASLERVCILFDGADASALEHARGQWRALRAEGIAAQYWSEASGRWRKEKG